MSGEEGNTEEKEEIVYVCAFVFATEYLDCENMTTFIKSLKQTEENIKQSLRVIVLLAYNLFFFFSPPSSL